MTVKPNITFSNDLFIEVIKPLWSRKGAWPIYINLDDEIGRLRRNDVTESNNMVFLWETFYVVDKSFISVALLWASIEAQYEIFSRPLQVPVLILLYTIILVFISPFLSLPFPVSSTCWPSSPFQVFLFRSLAFLFPFQLIVLTAASQNLQTREGTVAKQITPWKVLHSQFSDILLTYSGYTHAFVRIAGCFIRPSQPIFLS